MKCRYSGWVHCNFRQMHEGHCLESFTWMNGASTHQIIKWLGDFSLLFVCLLALLLLKKECLQDEQGRRCQNNRFFMVLIVNMNVNRFCFLFRSEHIEWSALSRRNLNKAKYVLHEMNWSKPIQIVCTRGLCKLSRRIQFISFLFIIPLTIRNWRYGHWSIRNTLTNNKRTHTHNSSLCDMRLWLTNYLFAYSIIFIDFDFFFWWQQYTRDTWMQTRTIQTDW